MKIILQVCVGALLVALTGLVVYAIELVHTATTAVSALPGEVSAARVAIMREVQAARQDVLVRSERQVAALRKEMLAEVDRIRVNADQRAGDTLAHADSLLDTVAGLRSDVKPLLETAQNTLHDADRTVIDLHPQMLGLMAASKVTAGETAQAMRSFRDAVPNFIAQGNAIAGNVNAATVEFSGVATNLNRITKPKWYDRLIGYGLSFGAAYRDLNPGNSVVQIIRGMVVKQQ